jgi:hypothetical protein
MEDVNVTAGFRMKSVNTIIDAWPMRFFEGPRTPQAQRDFALLLSTNHTGQERYVEWKARGDPAIEDVE